MLYRLKTSVAIGSFCLLSGCGFQPMMMGDPCHSQPFELHVKGEGYATYKFRRELEKQLSFIPQFDDRLFRLDVHVIESRVPSTYRHDADIVRQFSTLSANCHISQVIPGMPGKRPETVPITTSGLNVTTSYPQSLFVGRSADQAASNRTAIELAKELARDVVRLLKSDEVAY